MSDGSAIALLRGIISGALICSLCVHILPSVHAQRSEGEHLVMEEVPNWIVVRQRAGDGMSDLIRSVIEDNKL